MRWCRVRTNSVSSYTSHQPLLSPDRERERKVYLWAKWSIVPADQIEISSINSGLIYLLLLLCLLMQWYTICGVYCRGQNVPFRDCIMPDPCIAQAPSNDIVSHFACLIPDGDMPAVHSDVHGFFSCRSFLEKAIIIREEIMLCLKTIHCHVLKHLAIADERRWIWILSFQSEPWSDRIA